MLSRAYGTVLASGSPGHVGLSLPPRDQGTILRLVFQYHLQSLLRVPNSVLCIPACLALSGPNGLPNSPSSHLQLSSLLLPWMTFLCPLGLCLVNLSSRSLQNPLLCSRPPHNKHNDHLLGSDCGPCQVQALFMY
jgi:hypothetical protein